MKRYQKSSGQNEKHSIEINWKQVQNIQFSFFENCFAIEILLTRINNATEGWEQDYGKILLWSNQTHQECSKIFLNEVKLIMKRQKFKNEP